MSGEESYLEYFKERSIIYVAKAIASPKIP